MNEEAGPYAGMDRFEARKRDRRRPRSARACSRRRAVHARRRPLRPLRHRRRAADERAVVRRMTATRAGSRSIAGDALRRCATAGSTFVPQTRFDGRTVPYELDGEHPRLVHLAPALVGPPHPGLVLRQLRPDDGRRSKTPTAVRALRLDDDPRRTRTRSTPGSRRRCGRSRPWAGRTTPTTCAYFYPTSVMETGYDIIFFWVARMIMMGLFALDDVPFEYVYLHGTVRDDQGQRMSKSQGQRRRPAEVLIDRYGADALRFTLVTAGGTGNDQRSRRSAHGSGAQLRQQALERLPLRPLAARATASDVAALDAAARAVDARSRTAGSSRASSG